MSNPKEKAEELIFDFSDVGLITSIEAKQCALIAVDEIINAVNEWCEDYYWLQVKQELEKL